MGEETAQVDWEPPPGHTAQKPTRPSVWKAGPSQLPGTRGTTIPFTDGNQLWEPVRDPMPGPPPPDLPSGRTGLGGRGVLAGAAATPPRTVPHGAGGRWGRTLREREGQQVRRAPSRGVPVPGPLWASPASSGGIADSTLGDQRDPESRLPGPGGLKKATEPLLRVGQVDLCPVALRDPAPHASPSRSCPAAPRRLPPEPRAEPDVPPQTRGDTGLGESLRLFISTDHTMASDRWCTRPRLETPPIPPQTAEASAGETPGDSSLPLFRC